MEVFKIPSLGPKECEKIIAAEHFCRVVFHGEKYPYIAPFIYVWQNNHLYFLSADYGAKIKYFKNNPFVVVEIEQNVADLSHGCFVTLYGRLQEVYDQEEKKNIRESFTRLIKEKSLSKNIITAFGYSPEKNLDALQAEGSSRVWKLIDVDRVSGLHFGDDTP
jgi:uncharacterized protein